MAAIQINRTVDLSRMVQPEALTGVTFTEESGGHEFVLTAKDEVLSGTIKARFMRGDGSTTEFFGNTVDGVAHLTLTADCYEVAGRFLMTVFYDGGDGMAVIYAAVGHVVKSSNGAVTPSQPAAQSFEDILAGYVQRMTSATNAANTAADAASEAATDAEAAAASSVRYDVSQSLTETQQEQARENIGVVDKGLSDAAKTALLDCLAHVAYLDSDDDYYGNLVDALYSAGIKGISATFTQDGNVFSSTDKLDDLKPFLVVTETLADDTQRVVSDYTLTGDLSNALSFVGVTYKGKTAQFAVNVTNLPSGYTAKSYVEANGTQYIRSGVYESAAIGSYWSRTKEMVPQYISRAGHIFSSKNYFFPFLWSNGIDVFRVNAERFGASWEYTNDQAWSVNNIYELEAFKGGNDIKLNGEVVGTKGIGSNSPDTTSEFTFFTYGGGVSNTVYRFTGRMYYHKIFDSSNRKLHDYVPCVNSSNVVGLYDLVAGEFLAPTAGVLASD